MDRGGWWATVHGVTEGRTQLKQQHTHSHTHTHTHTHANQCSWVSVLKADQGKGDQEENPSSNRKKRKERKTHEGKY